MFFKFKSNYQRSFIRHSEQRILTIHKSKGLEFKVVIIPYCDWEMDHESTHETIIWVNPGKKPYDHLKLIPVKYKSDLAETYYGGDYVFEKMQA